MQEGELGPVGYAVEITTVEDPWFPNVCSRNHQAEWVEGERRTRKKYKILPLLVSLWRSQTSMQEISSSLTLFFVYTCVVGRTRRRKAKREREGERETSPSLSL